ncbi:7-deoxyloganetic acid glucosyl transferase-like [Impatiens glandulifera]|uniref:7-deoxyloganetic acid glucosyl transferase-like n=1 Tax=Impatiens glandulifera TaxID=253017 RepID=UPI001FB10444|nr:7-deoxyloganetic acid glucosyl transferase-like [Impatiens glandulifera]
MALEIPSHVIVFPFPVQGHVNSMLKLSELLCLSGIHVTFLNSDHNHCLFSTSDIRSYLLYRYPDLFNFATISDGLSDDHPRSGNRIKDLFKAIEITLIPLFKDMLISGRLNLKFGCFPTCIIIDGTMCSAINVGKDMGIPVIVFRTISASCFWAFFNIPNLIESNEIPLKDNCDMDKYVESVPGMEKILRLRDLPGFCRAADSSDFGLQMMMNQTQLTINAHGLILNTAEELEEEALTQIRRLIPNVYTIGPLHALLNYRLPLTTRPSTSLWEEDRSCMAWLDSQHPRSVIYVSFGSIAVMKSEDIVEILHGLENSGRPFLWVFRPNSVHGVWPVRELGSIGVKKQGYMVEWAPQEEVLAHPSVGGFLTHSGWNSTLESLVSGVPMICWPYFGDQQVNSRFVGEVWKTGLDMKDLCDRKVVEKMVNELLGVKKDMFLESTKVMAKLVNKSLVMGGTSSNHLDRLINDIKVIVNKFN